MEIQVRGYEAKDLPALTEIWNMVVEEANSFPQNKPFSPEEAEAFFASQSFTGVAEENGQVLGLYILHPNNVGNCGHIANASNATDNSFLSVLTNFLSKNLTKK